MICKYCGILVTEVHLADGLRYISDLKYCGLPNGLDCPKSPHNLHYAREK